MPKKRVKEKINTIQTESASEEMKMEAAQTEDTTEEMKIEAIEQTKPKRLRYVGKTINHFSHAGRLYQLIPNTVYVNLPDSEQVIKLIRAGELKEV